MTALCIAFLDMLTVKILLELPERWTLLHQAVDSHFVDTEQRIDTGNCVLAIDLVCPWVEVPRLFSEL